MKFEVLKGAKFHCELCGVTADIKALEVDHITPRSKGGDDDINNLQALCNSCNTMKRDRDDTDFHEIRESFKHREKGCLFCDIPPDRVVKENNLAYAIYDGYSVTELHTLVVPRRHVETYFELGQPEKYACNKLLENMKQ